MSSPGVREAYRYNYFPQHVRFEECTLTFSPGLQQFSSAPTRVDFPFFQVARAKLTLLRDVKTSHKQFREVSGDVVIIVHVFHPGTLLS